MVYRDASVRDAATAGAAGYCHCYQPAAGEGGWRILTRSGDPAERALGGRNSCPSRVSKGNRCCRHDAKSRCHWRVAASSKACSQARRTHIDQRERENRIDGQRRCGDETEFELMYFPVCLPNMQSQTKNYGGFSGRQRFGHLASRRLALPPSHPRSPSFGRRSSWRSYYFQALLLVSEPRSRMLSGESCRPDCPGQTLAGQMTGSPLRTLLRRGLPWPWRAQGW